MGKASNKIFRPINALLAFIAAFTVALTFYSCSKFYAYLPTSDTWVYSDFLAQSAQGHLDVAALFIKHNNAHLIALPKFIYFFDMWLTNGTGALVMLTSLSAMLATTAIFIIVISRITAINRQEKFFLSLLSVILLMSACQVESLLNPANLQWSLLVFSATLTAWFAYCIHVQKSPLNVAGLILGIALTTLTSASALLIILPLLMLRLGKRFMIRATFILIVIVLIALAINEIFFTDRLPLIAALFANWLKFSVDFLAPPAERLHSMLATAFAGILVFLGLFALARAKDETTEKTFVFFGLLLLFSLFVIFVTGVMRSYSPTAFTFRFVNIGLLFNAALFPLLYLSIRDNILWRVLVTPALLLYVGLLTYVNVTETSAFAFGRNHVRLTQVAHALDINDSFVVSAMPGTIWEKPDFDYIQANKYKLQDAHTGIYGSDAFKHVGLPINSLSDLKPVACTTTILKMRRLLPEQASYRLLGLSKTNDGKVMSQVYFVDDQNIIRGFAIPVEPNKNIVKGFFEDEQWAGFANLDADPQQKSLTLFAHNDKQICQGEKIDLPEFITLKKKQGEHGQD